MKILSKLFLIIPVMLLGLSCTKQNNIIPDDKLTACPINSECQSLFTEQADVNTQGMSPMIGSYRLFWNEYKTEGLSTKVFIKAPMEGNSFSLNKEDILSGRVLFIQVCPLCNLIPLKAVGGYVKGRNRNPGTRADRSRWLLEARFLS